MNVKFNDLINGTHTSIPNDSGIYKVIVPKNFNVDFLGYVINTTCKAYPLEKLKDKYLNQKDKSLLYIGKAKNLKRRIKQYVDYGQNKGKTHKGGRAIFQIRNFNELIVEILTCSDCEQFEKKFLKDFKRINNEYPLANWRC